MVVHSSMYLNIPLPTGISIALAASEGRQLASILASIQCLDSASINDIQKFDSYQAAMFSCDAACHPCGALAARSVHCTAMASCAADAVTSLSCRYSYQFELR